MSRFAVIGLGSFGMAAACKLASMGEEVLALDSAHDRVEAIKDRVRSAVVTDATERKNLVAVGIDRVDTVIISLSSRPHDATLVTLHAKELGVPRIVAKANSGEHAEILRRVGATRVVFPERDRALQLATRLAAAHVLDYLAFSDTLGVLELAPPTAMIGQSLSALGLGQRFNIQVVAVRELVPERLVVSPRAEFVVKPSDVLLVMGAPGDVARLQEADRG